MTRGLVIAVDRRRNLFALATEDGRYAVFRQYYGPPVLPGEVLRGDVMARGDQILEHWHGPCGAVGDSGPIPLDDALSRVSQRGAA